MTDRESGEDTPGTNEPDAAAPTEPAPPSTPPAPVPAPADPAPTVHTPPPPALPTDPASPPPPTVPAPATDQPRGRDGGRRTLILGAAAAVFFVLFLLAGPLGLWPSNAQLGGSDPVKARGEIETSATRFAENLVNFSYKSLDRDLTRVRRDATGSFDNEFREALGGSIDVFRKAIKEAKATSRGTVKGTIVSAQTKDDAVVIVYLTQSVSNEKSPKPRALPRFLQLTLVKSGSSWKVDDVKQLEIRAA